MRFTLNMDQALGFVEFESARVCLESFLMLVLHFDIDILGC